MRFFLDECVTPVLIRTLAATFLEHEFGSADGEDLRGTDDKLLFPAIRAAGYDSVLTADFVQMDDRDERAACRSAGLHWVGVRQVPVRGIRGVAYQASVVVAALPAVAALAQQAETPQLFKLKGTPREDVQLFHTETL